MELSPRIAEILERAGFDVRAREIRALPIGIAPSFQYAVSDGLRRLALIGVKHRDKMVLLLRPLRPGWRLHALFGREKFASAVLECLLREGAIKSPPPDEAKLRFLAASGDPMRAHSAKKMLDVLLREKKRKNA
jgi:hypothetical protein